MRKDALLSLIQKYKKKQGFIAYLFGEEICAAALIEFVDSLTLLSDSSEVLYQDFEKFCKDRNEVLAKLNDPDWFNGGSPEVGLLREFKKTQTRPVIELKSTDSFSSLTFVVRQTSVDFLETKEQVKLPTLNTFFYRKYSGWEYWKKGLLKLGCNQTILKDIHHQGIIQNYQKLYAALSHFNYAQICQFTYWQFFCLSGDPRVLEHGFANNFMTKETVDTDGSNPLYYTIFSGDLSSVLYLITNHGFNPKTKNDLGRTALHAAALSGHVHLACFLTKKFRMRPAEGDNKGLTSLHAAAEFRHLEMVKFFVIKCKVKPNLKSKAGITPLHLAANSGSISTLEFFHKDCELPLDLKDNHGRTAVHAAVLGGRVPMVKFLIDQCGVDRNIKAKFNESLLHNGSLSGQVDMVKCLLEYKGDLEEKTTGGFSVLHYANSVSMLKFLMRDQHMNPHQKTGRGYTVLHRAAVNGNKYCAKFLLSWGLKPTETDNDNHNAFWHAQQSKYPTAIIEALAELAQEEAARKTPSSP